MPDFDTRTPQEPDEPSRHRIASIAEKLRALLVAARSRVGLIANRVRSLLSATTLRRLLIGGGALFFVAVAVPVGLLIYPSGGKGTQRVAEDHSSGGIGDQKWEAKNANLKRLAACPDGGGGHKPGVPGDNSRGSKVVFVSGPQISVTPLQIWTEDPTHPSMEMYAVNADGSDLVQLTSATASELRILNILPDGRAMRFVWSSDGSTVQEISYDDPNLLPDGAMGACSPDDKKLATVTTDTSRATGDTSSAPPDDVDLSVRTSADTTGVPDHGEDYSDESSPVFSPDSEKLAFINTAEVYVANADGSAQRKLTNNVYYADYTETLVFSPDSKKIAFVGQLPGGPNATDLFVINVDGTGLTRLTSNPSNKYEIDLDAAYLFSPDSKKIGFVVYHLVREPGRGYQPVDHIEHDMYVVNVDGTGLTRLTHSEFREVGVVTWAGE